MKDTLGLNIFVLVADHGDKAIWLSDHDDAAVAHEVAWHEARRLRCDIVISIRDDSPVGKECCRMHPGQAPRYCAVGWKPTA